MKILRYILSHKRFLFYGGSALVFALFASPWLFFWMVFGMGVYFWWVDPDKVELESDYIIIYQDAEGRITKRPITLSKIAGVEEDIYLHAHCHMVDDRRTFRLDRIIEIYSGSTGEKINLDQFKKMILSYQK